MNEANGELEFNRGFAAVVQRKNNGEEDFNLERETLMTRITNIQSQIKMQHETESELRVSNEGFGSRLRLLER